MLCLTVNCQKCKDFLILCSIYTCVPLAYTFLYMPLVILKSLSATTTKDGASNHYKTSACAEIYLVVNVVCVSLAQFRFTTSVALS